MDNIFKNIWLVRNVDNAKLSQIATYPAVTTIKYVDLKWYSKDVNTGIVTCDFLPEVIKNVIVMPIIMQDERNVSISYGTESVSLSANESGQGTGAISLLILQTN